MAGVRPNVGGGDPNALLAQFIAAAQHSRDQQLRIQLQQQIQQQNRQDRFAEMEKQAQFNRETQAQNIAARHSAAIEDYGLKHKDALDTMQMQHDFQEKLKQETLGASMQRTQANIAARLAGKQNNLPDGVGLAKDYSDAVTQASTSNGTLVVGIPINIKGESRVTLVPAGSKYDPSSPSFDPKAYSVTPPSSSTTPSGSPNAPGTQPNPTGTIPGAVDPQGGNAFKPVGDKTSDASDTITAPSVDPNDLAMYMNGDQLAGGAGNDQMLAAPPPMQGVNKDAAVAAAGPGLIKSLQDAPTQFQPVLQAAATKYGIDPHVLTSLIYHESRFNPNAVGPTNDLGIAQFIPGTAKMYGVDRLDPVSSINGAAHMLSDNLQRYNGNYGLALAAYNGGPGGGDKWAKNGTGNPQLDTYVRSITGVPLKAWVNHDGSAANTAPDKSADASTAPQQQAQPPIQQEALQDAPTQSIAPTLQAQNVVDDGSDDDDENQQQDALAKLRALYTGAA